MIDSFYVLDSNERKFGFGSGIQINQKKVCFAFSRI